MRDEIVVMYGMSNGNSKNQYRPHVKFSYTTGNMIDIRGHWDRKVEAFN